MHTTRQNGRSVPCPIPGDPGCLVDTAAAAFFGRLPIGRRPPGSEAGEGLSSRHCRVRPLLWWYAVEMIQVGPYRFSATDARATLRHADDLFDLLVDGVDPAIAGLAAPFRATAIAALASPMDGALEACWTALRAAGDALRAAGAYGASARGNVAQLNTSGGGVPKRPVERVEVGFGGIVGDRQATRRHHGRPWQALSLWSAEVIDDFARDGHPISYGSAGENITVTGLEWARVRPGVELDVGTVRCDVVAFAAPCKQNAGWFRGGDFNLMHHHAGPVARVYTLVTRPGTITSRDQVILAPA